LFVGVVGCRGGYGACGGEGVKINIGVCSFANFPYEMRSEKDLESLGKVLGK
jgi:hypothetical protein